VSSADSTGWLAAAGIAVPVSHGRLPDGSPTVVIGDVRGWAAVNHRQGDNPDHDGGDCGMVARAPYDGALEGFYINDSGTGQSGHFVART
jgi:hypothetical protein